MSSIYFLDLSWSSFTSLRISSNVSAILISGLIDLSFISLSIFYLSVNKYILYYPITIVKSFFTSLPLGACRLKLGPFFRMQLRIILKWPGSELPEHARSSFTTPASVNSLPPFNHLNSAPPRSLRTRQR